MRNKLFLFILVVLSIFILSSCSPSEEETFKLTLPPEVSANISDLDFISKDTVIILTVEVPTNSKVETFKVNGESVTLTNDTYIFTIIEDTVVTITFIPLGEETVINYYSLTLPDEVSTNLINLTQIEAGTEITLTVTPPANKSVESFKVNDVEVALDNNTYTFNITKDTVVTVIFKGEEVTSYYSLTLPEGISANVSDLTEIKENTVVTLTVRLDLALQLESVIVNGQAVTLVNDSYTFTIKEDTVVYIAYSQDWVEVDQANGIQVFNNLDFDLFKAGTIKYDYTITEDEYIEDQTMLIDIDGNLNIILATVVNKKYYNGELDEVHSTYLDGLYYYEIIDSYSNGQVYYTFENVFYFDSSLQAMETFGMLAAENPFMPVGFLSINDFITYSLLNSGQDFTSGEHLNSVEFMRKGSLFKVSFNTGNIDVFDLFNEYTTENTTSQISFIFDALSLKEINIELDNNIDLTISYTEQAIDVDQRFGLMDTSTIGHYTYYYHLGDGEIVEIKLDEGIANELPYFITFEIFSLLNPYKENKRVKAFYLDEDFTIELEPSDFLTDELNIYVKWEDLKLPEVIISELTEDNKLWLKSYDGYPLYYEDDNYIYYERHNSTISIVDKINEKHFEVNLNTSQTVEAPYLSDRPFLLDTLSALTNKDFVFSKGLFIGIKEDILLAGSQALYFFYDDYAIIEPDLYLINDDPFDISIIDQYIADATKDEIRYFGLVYDDFYIDVNQIEEEISFLITYHSGFYQTVPFSFVLEEGFTYDINEQTLNIYYNGQHHYYNYFIFYDSSLGTAIIVDDYQLYYLESLTDLPTLDMGEFFKLEHFEADDDAIIANFDDLLNYNYQKPYLAMYSSIIALNAPDIIEKVKEYETVHFTSGNYEFSYDIIKRLYEVNYQGQSLIIEIDEQYYTFSTTENYLKLPVEQFDLDDLYFRNWYKLFPNFYFGAKAVLGAVILFDDILNNEMDFTNAYSGYLFDNGLEFAVEYIGIYIIVDNFFALLTLEDDGPLEVEPVTNQTYLFEIYNNVSTPITLKGNSDDVMYHFNYNFLNHAIEGYYHTNIDGKIVLGFPFDREDIIQLEYDVFANYVELFEPTAYFTALNENEKYVLRGETYTIYVHKDLYVGIYTSGELIYLIDLIEEKAYYYQNSTLEEIYLIDELFNFVDFAEKATDEMFIFDYLNHYNLISNRYKDDLTFVINVSEDSFTFEDNFLANDTYQIGSGDFTTIDYSGIPRGILDIISIDIIKPQNIFSINDLDQLSISLTFDNGVSQTYTYDEFIENFNGYYADNSIFFYYFDELKEIDLADYDISVYDEGLDQVVIFFAYPASFVYLNELVQLPILSDRTYELFKGWSRDLVGITPLTIPQIQAFSDEVIYLYPIYQIPKVDELFEHLESLGTVELELNYRNYYENHSTRLFAHYNYEEDYFLVRMAGTGYRLAVGFEDDFVYVKTNDIYIKYDPSIFTLKSTTIDSRDIHHFTKVIADLIKYRELLNNAYAGEKIINFYYYDNQYYRLMVTPNADQIAVIVEDNYHYIKVVDPFEGDINLDLYRTTLLVETDFSEDYITISSNEYKYVYEYIFFVEGYEFNNYYFTSEMILPGGVPYTHYEPLSEDDFGHDEVTLYPVGLYEAEDD